MGDFLSPMCYLPPYDHPSKQVNGIGHQVACNMHCHHHTNRKNHQPGGRIKWESPDLEMRKSRAA